jgi:glycosyltransferase involved in cell wall biosynthesis
MEKLLIIYNKVWPYREKIFELLNEVYEVTVAFNDPKFIGKKYSFKTLYMPGKNIGPFFVHSDNIHKIARNYDAIIGLYDIRWIKLMILSLLPFRKYSISYWGIGVTASYKNKFDSKSTWDYVRYFFAKWAESIILYSDYPIKKHLSYGISRDKLFIANNTTDVYHQEDGSGPSQKSNFLFVGTLYPQKGFEILLEAYMEILRKNINAPLLEIVGDGPEYETINRFIIEKGLDKKIILHGGIYNPQELSLYYKRAIACISPKQAGLSVLTSMGNSTIFVTEKDAITGGEIFNIENMVNGIIYQGSAMELAATMEWILCNTEKALLMSKAARFHYLNNRTPQQMADAIIDAVNFAKKKKR